MFFGKKKKQDEFDLTGEVFEFHQGKYRARITLKTPDGRVTKIESEDDFPVYADAKKDMTAMLDKILADFKGKGVEIGNRTETETVPSPHEGEA